MRHVYLAATALFMLPVGCSTTDHDANPELQAMQGTWEAVHMERDGKEVTLSNDNKTTSSNTGNKFIVRRGDQVIAAGSFAFDPSKSPRESETTYTEGPDTGKTFKGIHEIDGDTMKFCRAGSPDDERPTEFKTKPGSGQFAADYQREQQ